MLAQLKSDLNPFTHSTKLVKFKNSFYIEIMNPKIVATQILRVFQQKYLGN